MRVFVGITGASGAPYAKRLVEVLAAGGCEVGLCVSAAGVQVLATELYAGAHLAADEVVARLIEGAPGRVELYDGGDWRAPYASGSARVDAYVVCPCSGGTLGAIAAGMSQNLIQRAAAVALKERRRLVLCPRETPLSQIQLEHMLALARAGATILPLEPGFYHGSGSVAELVDFVVARILDQVGLAHELSSRWGSEQGARP